MPVPHAATAVASESPAAAVASPVIRDMRAFHHKIERFRRATSPPGARRPRRRPDRSARSRPMWSSQSACTAPGHFTDRPSAQVQLSRTANPKVSAPRHRQRSNRGPTRVSVLVGLHRLPLMIGVCRNEDRTNARTAVASTPRPGAHWPNTVRSDGLASRGLLWANDSRFTDSRRGFCPTSGRTLQFSVPTHNYLISFLYCTLGLSRNSNTFLKNSAEVHPGS